MLHVNTELGQVTMRHQHEALELFKSRFPNLDYAETSTKGESAGSTVDAFIMRGKTVIGIAEVKTRYVPRIIFEVDYENEWLLSTNKLEKAKQLCDFVKIPYWGMVYLRPDNVLLCKKLYDPIKKKFVCNFRKRHADVYAPVELRRKSEICDFIDMNGAFIIDGDETKTDDWEPVDALA